MFILKQPTKNTERHRLVFFAVAGIEFYRGHLKYFKHRKLPACSIYFPGAEVDTNAVSMGQVSL